jgi:hypothetical protein
VKHGSAPAVEDLCGVWVRRSLEWADGRSDTTTRVTWLQGSEWFVDLRLPAVRPSDGARTPQPEAFAGRLVRTLSDATEFMWHRTIDWSPDSGPDVGRLSWDGDNLIEEGVLQPYREVWIRAERHSPDDSATALLRDDTGRLGIVLRSAGFFGFAVGWQIRSSTQIETEGVPICIEIKDKLAVIDVTGPPDCRCLLSGAWHISGTVGDPSLLQTR